LQSVFFYPLVDLFEHLFALLPGYHTAPRSRRPYRNGLLYVKSAPNLDRRIRVRRTWQKNRTEPGVTPRLGSGGCCDGDVLGSSACLMMVIWTRAEKEFRSRPLEDGTLFLEHPQGPVPERMHPAVVSQVHPVKHAPRLPVRVSHFFNLFAVDSLIFFYFPRGLKHPPQQPERTFPRLVRFLNLLNFALAVT